MSTASYSASFTDATRPVEGADRVGTLSWKHEVLLPEDVKAAFEVASPFARVLAFLLDTGIIVLGWLGIAFIALTVMASSPLAMMTGMMIYAILILSIAALNMGYFFVFEGMFSGQTPGKYLMKLRVIKEDGEEIGPREGIIRAFVRMAIVGPMPALIVLGLYDTELLMYVAPFSVLAVVMFVDRKSRGVPDFFANTVVVQQKVPDRDWRQPHVPLYFQLPHHFFPLNADEMNRLAPDDYAKLQEFGARLSTVSSEARQQAAMAAAAALATRMKYSKPIEPEFAEVFLFEMHAALKQQLQQLYPDLYA